MKYFPDKRLVQAAHIAMTSFKSNNNDATAMDDTNDNQEVFHIHSIIYKIKNCIYYIEDCLCYLILKKNFNIF